MPTLPHTWILSDRGVVPAVVDARPSRFLNARRPEERGFSLVEIIVVLAIIAILLAIVSTQFRGSKRAAHYKVATSTAIGYADAIEAYMADNGQTPPVLGSTVWPNTSRAQRLGGPLNLMLVDSKGQPRRYMKLKVPEAIQSGVVDFGTNKATAAANASAYITYQIVGAEYRLLVETLPRGSGSAPMKCVITNGTALPAGYKRCG